MNNDDERVPTSLLCAGSDDDRDTAIARPIESANEHPVAVFHAGAGMLSDLATPLGRTWWVEQSQ